jgi:N-acetylated-alpha-linked acidic dipeptidase
MSMAETECLPCDYTDYANQIRDFFNEAVKLAKRRNLGSSFDEKGMTAAVEDFASEAARLEKSRQEAISKGADSARLKRINEALIAGERAFIDPTGLLGRVWYKHQIYAPGVYTGYAAQPLTDFRQAIDERNSAGTRAALDKIVDAIKRATNALRQARD